MSVTAQKIIEELRGLPPEERLHVVERVVHEVAAEVTASHPLVQGPIWADESDSDFRQFRSAVDDLRARDTWRLADEPDPT